MEAINKCFKFKILIFLLGLFWIPLSVSAETDSLNRLLTRAKSDTEKIRLLNQIALEQLDFDLSLARKTAQKALHLSLKSNYARGVAQCYETNAHISFFENDYHSAIRLWKKSLLTSYLPSDYSRINQLLGNTYMQMGNYDSALWHYIRAEKMVLHSISPLEHSYLFEDQSVALVNLNQFDSAYNVLQQGINLLEETIKNIASDKTEYNKMLIQIASLQGQAGNVLFKAGKFTDASALLHKAVAVLTILGETNLLPILYDDQGDIFKAIGNYDKAIESYYKALKINEEKNDKLAVAASYNSIAGIYYEQNAFQKAEELFRAAFNIHSEVGNKAGIAQLLNNLGEVQRNIGNLDSAMSLYKEAIKINQRMNNQLWMGVNYQNIGEVFLQANNYQEAIENFNKALQYYKATGNKTYLTSLNNSLGSYYLQKKDYTLAKKHFEEAFDNAQRSNIQGDIKISAKGLSEIAEHTGDYKKALYYFKLFNTQSEMLLNVEMNRQMAEIQSRHELEKKENEITIQKEQINILEKNEKISDLVLQASMAAFILLSVIAYLVYSRKQNRSRSEIDLAKKSQEVMEARQALMEADIKNKEQEKQILNQELHQKNNHLINMALYLAHKNDFINELKTGLKETRSLSGDDKEKRLNELILKISQQTRTSRELDRLQSEIELANDAFFKKLEHICPEMTENERQLSALLRINLSSKEIASLNNISTKAVEMSRYRLRKKLNLEGNNTLTDFLQQL